MMTRFATFTSRLAVALTTTLAIAACGGGGGGGFKGGAGSDGDTDTYFIQLALKDSEGNPTSTVTANQPGTLQVLVTENNENGAPVADVIVNASTDSGLLDPSSGNALTNAEGAVTFTVRAGADRGAGTIVIQVTDENGVSIEESVNFEIGVGALRLGRLEGTTFFDAEIGISPDGPITAKGEAILDLAIVDQNGLPIGTAESITINSLCIDVGDSTLTPANPIPVIDGRIEVTYTSEDCAGSDELTAEVIGAGAMAFGTVEVADAIAGGLTFVRATPDLIVLKGTGGGPSRQEKSEVVFQVIDGNNQPVEDVDVVFSLTTNVGGLTFSPKTATSDASGNVSTIVSSGDVATVVRVQATADAGDLGEASAVSDVLTVSTGLPDQNSISLSVEGSFVVEEGMTKDGVTRCLSVRMADKFNNPVPDGTAAIFTTEYGAIDSACATGLVNGDRASEAGCEEPIPGRCSVAWISQSPRVPTLEENQALVVTIADSGYSCSSHSGTSGPCPVDLGTIRGGRSTILVTAIGEESFVDSNANGIYDEGEGWANLTEAFLDQSENGLYDPATTSCLPSNNPDSQACKAGSEEIFTDFNSNGQFDVDGDDELNGYPDEDIVAVYNGLLCPVDGDINDPAVDRGWCSRTLLNVRDSLVLSLSTDPNWEITDASGVIVSGIALYNENGIPVAPASGTSFDNTYTAYVSDIFNNQPPAGSQVKVEASAPCEILGTSTFKVPNKDAPGAFSLKFTQDGEVEYASCKGESAPDATGELTITLTPENGGEDYSQAWQCTAKITDKKDDCPEPEPEDGDDDLTTGPGAGG
jgi:hypothetical protein